MTRVALTWYVWDTTRSPQALGVLSFSYMAPIFAGGLVAGWLLDRFGRRNVMVADNLVRAAAILVIPVLYALGSLQVWHAYVVAAAYGSLMMISLAGGPALIPSLVPRQNLPTANALETIGFTVSSAIGPTLAGFLVATVGAPNVLLVDAASYVLFALALTRVPTSPPTDVGDSHTPETFGPWAAIRLMISNRILLSTTLMYMAFNLGLGMMFVWLPIFSDEVLDGGARLYGGLLGLMAVGALTSSLLAGTVTLPWTLGTMISTILILSGISLGLMVLFQSVWVTVASITLFGFFNAPLTIWAQTLRMQIIPERLRGRAFALMRMLMQGANPIGGLAAGPLIPVLGLILTMTLSATFVGAAGVVGLRVRELRRAGSPRQV